MDNRVPTVNRLIWNNLPYRTVPYWYGTSNRLFWVSIWILQATLCVCDYDLSRDYSNTGCWVRYHLLSCRLSVLKVYPYGTSLRKNSWGTNLTLYALQPCIFMFSDFLNFKNAPPPPPTTNGKHACKAALFFLLATHAVYNSHHTVYPATFHSDSFSVPIFLYSWGTNIEYYRWSDDSSRYFFSWEHTSRGWWGPWIRMRIRIPDPGRQKWYWNRKKLINYLTYEMLNVLFWGLKASHVAWTFFKEA